MKHATRKKVRTCSLINLYSELAEHVTHTGASEHAEAVITRPPRPPTASCLTLSDQFSLDR
jgi:hypothetical protein